MSGREFPESMKIAAVHKSYRAIYETTVRIKVGDRLIPLRKDADWPGWSWCRANDGIEGWVPDEVIQKKEDILEALEDYDARELTVTSGERIRVFRSISGWAWCETMDGRSGWLPLDHLDFGAE